MQLSRNLPKFAKISALFIRNIQKQSGLFSINHLFYFLYMKKLYFFPLILACLTLWQSAKASPPSSYYQTINGLAEEQLKTALCNLIYNHKEVSSYSALPDYFKRTDVKPGTNYWWDMYSDMNVPTNISFGTYMNREHSFPKSWWGGSTATPAYVDLYHLYPSEAKANMAKSNYPLGEVSGSPTFDNNVVKVGPPVNGQGGGARIVFEPNDEYKGDFARTYFYVVTCYQDLTWAKNYDWMLVQGDYPTLKPWAISLLLKWNEEDPVSQKEIDRNEVVYSIQANRNPFIDYPELAEYIWGDKKGNKFYVPQSGITGDPTLITPENGMALDFTQTAINNTITENMLVKGENLTKSLSLRLYGDNSDMFSIDATSLSANAVNAAAGINLRVTYHPTTLGRHEAKIILFDGGITPVTVDLIGEALPVPELHAFKALPASNITATSYTANWEESPDIIDYYVVTRTRYINGSSASEDILAESNSLIIDDFEADIPESYNVRAVALGYYSPRTNEIYVDNAGIVDVVNDMPLGWAPWFGGIRIVCGDTHTNLTVYDTLGRLIRIVPSIENDDIIDLPLGAYLIVTDQQRKPLRVIVTE